MVLAFSDLDKLPSNLVYIREIEAEFSIAVSLNNLEDTDRQIMINIDNATVIDGNIGTVKTPFGITGKNSLSRGCKTALLVNYLRKNNRHEFAVDVISCGCNALDEVYKIIDDTGMCIVQHYIPTHECKWTGKISFDGKVYSSPLVFMINALGGD